ncbi:WYL domain-containing protein [Reinekea sp. G2M2-21]|uniref:WYL domain-containing protein n=1 Tax=Reinekea sp. G2M2-21 TaxID=2788942 RepID=UPI0018AC6AE3|nr:WYL domain-containing protein [Reinekea sp. G2M2-21]
MNDSTKPKLEEQSQPQQERLFYLEFRLYFLGHANRSDLQKRFGLKESSASRDIALYKKLAPENVVYDYGIKSYIPQDTFVPLYSYTATQVLTALTYGFGDDYAGPKFPEIATESPSQTPLPFIPTLAAITRAIHKQQALSVEYISETKGSRVQAIVPHALINSGTRWLVRAYDRGQESFNDFVINRVTKVLGESDAPQLHELKESDADWNRIINLTLKPHPALAYPDAVAQEFGMHGGVLKMTCRAALESYMLSKWNVDMAATPSTEVGKYQLWLVKP